MMYLPSESGSQDCVSGPLARAHGLCIALEVWGLGDRLDNPREDSPAPEPVGEAQRSSLRLDVRKPELQDEVLVNINSSASLCGNNKGQMLGHSQIPMRSDPWFRSAVMEG